MPINDPDQYYDDGRQATPDPLVGMPGPVGNVAPDMRVAYPMPAYQYDGGAGYTSTRASYGAIPVMGMQGAYAASSGAMMGVGNMFSAIGEQIMPVTYTPPARVLSDYSGRYIQNVGVMADVKTLLGFGPMLRSAREADMRYNAASDLGERMALGGIGAGLSVAGLGVAEAGSMLGSGMLGGIFGNLVGGMGGFALAGYATDKIQQGVAARRDIQGFLEATSDRYITSGSGLVDPRRGAGFSSGGRVAVGNFIRELDVADPMLDTQDLTKILRESTNLGLFTGTKDVDDFKSKFKTIVDNVKTVTTTLHQTLEEGLKTIRDLRSIGVDPSMVGSVVQRAETFGRASGRSAGEMLNLGLQGAELFRGTGISMQIGFESNLMNATAIRAARDAGMLSQEAISQAGGEEALAQRMTASSLAYTQTAAGRGFSALFFNNGSPGSGFNQQAFTNLAMSGGGDLFGNAMTAARNLGTPASLIKFQAHQEDMLSEMGKMFGGQGLQVKADMDAMMQATALSRMTGASTEDAFRMVLKTQGKSQQEVDAELAKIRTAPDAFRAAQRSAETTREQTIQQAASQNFFINRWQAQLGDFVTGAADIVAKPANELVERVSQGAANAADYLNGIQRVNLAGTGFDTTTLADETAARSRRNARAVNIDVGGQLGDNAGRALAEAIRNKETGPFTFTEGGNVTLENFSLGKRTISVSAEDLEKNSKLAAVLGTTLASAQEADAHGELKTQRAVVHNKLTELFSSESGSQQLQNAKNIGDVVQAVYGKRADQISKTDYQALVLETQGSERMKKMESDAQKTSEKILAANNAVSVGIESGSLERANSARDAVNEQLGLSKETALSGASVAALADYRRLARRGGSAEERESSRQAFVKTLHGDSQLASATTILAQAELANPELGGALTEMRQNYSQIAEEQQLRGLDRLSKMDESGRKGIEASEARQAEAIKGAKTGSDLAEKLKGLTSADNIQGLVKSFGGGGESGVRSAIEAVHAQTLNTIAGDSNVAAAGATSGVGTTGTASAEQTMALQTSMNSATLAVMQGLAAKLGVH